MRRLLFIMLLNGALGMTVNTVRAENVSIRVTQIDAARGGSILVMIFGPTGYPTKHDAALAIKSRPASNEALEFDFEIERNEVAVKVLHDADGNNRVTKNWTGFIPAEGLGFSNGQRLGITGPPSYKASKLSRPDYLSGIEIMIAYP